MKPLCLAEQMRALDTWTMEESGLPGIVLMENAGKGMAELIEDTLESVQGLRTTIICGRGNNGGDGFVIGRWLDRWGAEVVFYVLAELESIQGDAAVNLKAVQGLDLPVVEILNQDDVEDLALDLEETDLVVDALLGTGLNAPVKGRYKEAIDLINSCEAFVASVDIPSGISADTGKVMGAAVQADLTGTFGAAKLGQAVYPGLEYCGELEVIDISIPDEALPWDSVDHLEVEAEDVAEFWPVPGPRAHKGDCGHLLILAGSEGKTGAACLTAQGALRVGTGLVTVGCPAGVNHILENKLTEAMTLPLAQTADGFLSAKAVDSLAPFLEGKSALAFGPGLGTDPETGELLAWIVEKVPLPLVIDADGLNLLAQNLEMIRWCADSAVLTPHPGEMARLLKTTTEKVQADRIKAVKTLVQETGQVVVLKGARTVVGSPEGLIFVNPTGNPGLANGGAGDVLTGIIGGLLAQELNALEAALAGVYIHGLAGDMLAQEIRARGFLASEVAEMIPEAVASLFEEE